MDVSRFRHTDRIVVARPPEEVYDLVADITGIGKLSPVCVDGEWVAPATAAEAGAQFRGHNKIGEFGWTTTCRVDVAERGREFTFTNLGPDGDVELVRWGYTFAPADGGTEVVESWQVLPAYPDFVLSGTPDADVEARIEGMAGMARDGMKTTLANLKAVAEG